jgi:alpha-N-arabinofuranosidase
MYGAWQVGAMSAEEYVREATRWARAIRMLDPGAVLIGCGETGWTEWDRVVIDGLAGLVDYHSVHLYTGSDDYWTNVLQPHQAERAIRSAAAMIERTAYRQSLAKMPRIAYDEWNVWYRVMAGDLAERYTHPDALAVATYLNIFIRHSGWVKMANLAQMVNAIAPIVATPETAVVQPVYYPVLLHARAALDVAVDVRVEGETVRPELPPGASRWPYHVADLGPFTLIDAAASVNAAGVNNRQIAVTLVNRAPSSESARIVLRDFAFDGAAAITTVTAGGAAEPRTLPDVATAHLEEGVEYPVGGAVELTLPPRSFAVVEAPITACIS